MVMLSDSLFSFFFFFLIRRLFIVLFGSLPQSQVMVIHKMRRGALDKQIRKDFERNCSPTKKDRNHRNRSYI